MTITLTPEQQAWIDARVARGEYASTQDAARSLIDAGIALYEERQARNIARLTVVKS